MDFIRVINLGGKNCSLRPEFAIRGLCYSKTRLIMYKKNSMKKECSSYYNGGGGSVCVLRSGDPLENPL